MANKVDVLFESVLGALGEPPDQENHSDFPWSDETFDEPFEDQGDLVQTFDEATDLRRVLERMSGDQNFPDLHPDEQDAAEKSIQKAAESAEAWVERGLDFCMNQYNAA